MVVVVELGMMGMLVQVGNVVQAGSLGMEFEVGS